MNFESDEFQLIIFQIRYQYLQKKNDYVIVD